MTPGSRYSDPQRGRHATIINVTADHIACTLEDARGPMRRLADHRLPAASHVYILPRAFFLQRYTGGQRNNVCEYCGVADGEGKGCRVCDRGYY